jgi:hypothetical protein
MLGLDLLAICFAPKFLFQLNWAPMVPTMASDSDIRVGQLAISLQSISCSVPWFGQWPMVMISIS